MSQDEVSQADVLAPSRSSLSNSLTTLLKLGGAVTATGFLVGWLYQQGLMDGMELPSNIFPAKIEDLLFMTYLVALAASTVALSSFAEYLIWGAIAAIIAGLVVGVSVSMTSLFAPEMATIVMFALMALILLVRPNGLYGRPAAGL